MGNLFHSEDEDQLQKKEQRFHFNEATAVYGTNEIKSTTTTALTFVPLNILHQFSNIPNSTTYLI